MSDFSCPADHKHGATSTCYSGHRCRCTNCREGHRTRMDHRRRQQAYGRWEPGRVDGTTTRAHLIHLRRLGWTLETIAAQAGVKHTTVMRISCSITNRVLPTTRDAILNLPLKAPAVLPWGRVDATGTHRRLQALMFMGWTGAELERRLEWGNRSMGAMLRKPLVTVTTASKVRDLYEQLWTTTPPQTPGGQRTKKRARANGWVGPLHWDNIDDPREIPEVVDEVSWTADRFDEQVIDAAIFGDHPEMSPRERREVITVLNERRWSGAQIAEHIGCSRKTVERVRRELGLPIYLYNDTTYRKVA